MLLTKLVIELLTPMHCGGGEDRYLDQPVVRDAFGHYYIPGTSIAGILRHLAEKIDPQRAEKAFGKAGDITSMASFIECADAHVIDYDGKTCLHKSMRGEGVMLPAGPFIRDHVRITSEGVAQDAGKFDEEIIPAGTRFALQVSLNTAWGEPDAGVREVYLDCMARIMGGQIQFGAKRTNGYGLFSVVSGECREIDLHTVEGMEAFLNLKEDVVLPDSVGNPVDLPKADMLPSDSGYSGFVDIPLVAEGPILIGGGESDESDIASYKTPLIEYDKQSLRYRYVIPSTSIKGVIRHAVERIADSLFPDDVQDICKRMFGTVDGEASVGNICFYDALLPEKAREKVVQHVAIDRFTGGSLQSALYDEAPVWDAGAKVTARVVFSGLTAQEAGLLAHALMDLCSGRIPLGGGGNRGNGYVVLQGLAENGWQGALEQLTTYGITGPDCHITPRDNSQAGLLCEALENALGQEVA